MDVFQIGSHELTPTLEEWACISGLHLHGPCTWVEIGEMCRQFIHDLGLTWVALVVEAPEGHVNSLDFIPDMYGSLKGFFPHRDQVCVDALIGCIISFL